MLVVDDGPNGEDLDAAFKSVTTPFAFEHAKRYAKLVIDRCIQNMIDIGEITSRLEAPDAINQMDDSSEFKKFIVDNIKVFGQDLFRETFFDDDPPLKPDEEVFAREANTKVIAKQKAIDKYIDWTVNKLGIIRVHPSNTDPTTWLPPYGSSCQKISLDSVLRMTLQEKMADDETLQDVAIRHTNKCQIHTCQLKYCLHKTTPKSKESKKGEDSSKATKGGAKEQQSKPEAKAEDSKDSKDSECRFGFPKPYIGFVPHYAETEQGGQMLEAVVRETEPKSGGGRMVTMPEGGDIDDKGKKLQTLRNHPAMNRFILELGTLIFNFTCISKCILHVFSCQ